MKDALNFFWEHDSKREATRWLKEWVEIANASGISMLMTFAKTIQGYRSGLLAWYDYPISTGPLEGTSFDDLAFSPIAPEAKKALADQLGTFFAKTK